jgi:hypothetical protein
MIPWVQMAGRIFDRVLEPVNVCFSGVISGGPGTAFGRLLSVTTLLPVSDPLRTVAQRSKLRTFYLAKTSVLSRLGKSQV